MSTITIEQLTFAYPGQSPIFKDVTLHLDTSWKLGLIGRNGRGKTTLLDLLRGTIKGTGTIIMPQTCHYFPQELLQAALTVDAIQATTDAPLWQIQRELNLLEVDPEILGRPFNTLSGGEQTKVKLALLFTDENSFALIDEPTNHLDQTGRQQVAHYLASKSGYIVVSHDRTFLNATTDHILAIERHQISQYQGNYQVYAEEKAAQDDFELAKNHQLKGEIDRLKSSAQAKQQWANAREADKYGKRTVPGSGAIFDTGAIGARAARVMQKRKNAERRMVTQIDAKEALLQNIEKVDALSFEPTVAHYHSLVTARKVQLSYTHPLFAPISFTVQAGERIAIVGPNGSGKTSLFHALIGQFDGHIAGELTVAPSKMSLVSQQYTQIQGTLPDFAASHHLTLSSFITQLRKLGLAREALTIPIESLSLGQKKKVAIAAALCTRASLYLWDEPLNYLDLANQDQLITAILRDRPTMLFTEHDPHFITAVATRVITLHPASK